MGGCGHPGAWDTASHSAEATLAERLAQGDIDEKEYRARLEVLRANNPQRPPVA
jgi:putative membrane protein